MDSEHFDALPKGYRFEGFEMVRILGHGGFGITYLAFDDNLNKAVAIKEFLPDGVASRDATNSVVPKSGAMEEDFDWGLSRFLDEAQTLAHFRHDSIIQVHRFFRANGTGYIVMEYAEGQTLGELLQKHGKLPKDQLWAIMEPLLDGLEAVHARDFLHRDIKPGNIIIRDDGPPVLIDFGAARLAIGSKSKSLTSIISPGFAPLEQYSSDSDQGPWTDIYAMGAVAYLALTGTLPPDPTTRIPDDPYMPVAKQLEGKAPERFLQAIDWALALFGPDRPLKIAKWRAALEGGKSEGVRQSAPKPTPAPREKPPKARPIGGHKIRPPPKKPKQSRILKGFAWLTVLALLAAIAFPFFAPTREGVVGQPTNEPTELEEENDSQDETAVDERADEAAWAEADTLASADSYNGYLLDFPEGGHAREARTKLTPYEITWEKKIGTDETEQAKAITVLPGGGFAVAGYSHASPGPSGGPRSIVFELTGSGELIWEKSFPDAFSGAKAIAALPNGDFATAGRGQTFGSSGKRFANVMKFDRSGELLWNGNFGERGWDGAESIIALPDNGFIVAGGTSRRFGVNSNRVDAWIFRLNGAGELLWENTYGEIDTFGIQSVIALPQGEFAALASSRDTSSTLQQAVLIKFADDGQMTWKRTYGESQDSRASDMVLLPDGGFAVVGGKRRGDGVGFDPGVFKLDTDANLVWENIYPADAARGDRTITGGTAIVALSDGGLVITADIQTGNNTDVWLMRLGRTGALLWDKVIGGPAIDKIDFMIALADGALVLSGNSGPLGGGDAWVLRLDPPG